MEWSAKWIRPIRDMGDVCPVFSVDFSCMQNVKNAMLKVTATGVYEAVLNGRRVGEFILAPGWTVYEKRLQVQEYDVTDMNSFNHYAYGAVADWVYCQAAGINTVEAYPGYEKIRIAPLPDSRLDWLEATLKTRHGVVSSRWQKQEGMWRYDIDTPVETTVVISGKEYRVEKGKYVFYSEY